MFLFILRIFTQEINADGQICVRFAYHMYGSDIGTLTVYTQTGGGANSIGNNLGVWTKERSQGNQWVVESLDVTISRNQRVSTNTVNYSCFK